ncbi:serine hydrolase [Flavobacterium sp. Sd200]|uniref:serine hydrolase domain-containing protein n=1 Tax=Flavobacterium sp. Sd200 TaxID=2692211 RepID=UPI00136AD01B|nr:serine hydrolase [Flavobacterium sp. Sd200]MXN90713.1 serine hydrolase [Flavobacterium sp. Sd200]
MKINIIRFLAFTSLFFVATSCKVGRFVYYNFPNITDHKIFPARTAEASEEKHHFLTTDKPKVPKSFTVGGKETQFEYYLEKNNSVAFMIIKNDTIQYEKYFNGYNEESVVASFSMAKSVTSLLVGCALDDGIIRSVEEPIVNYVPEFADKPGFEKITIKNLLQMTSGIKCSENYYSPFSDAATYYYGTDVRKFIFKRELEHKPGTYHIYSSGDTQILGLVLERALKGKSITAYLEEKVWKPMGMEYDATWSIDNKDNGLEKTFCCLNARARDFARLGSLYLHKGNWNGRQIVSKEWVEVSTTPDLIEGGVINYKYQWWLQADGSYLAKGTLGQYIYVNPAKKLIIVRLGENYGNADWLRIFESLAANY